MGARASESRRLFGTDGIRGPAGEYPLDRPTVSRLGAQLAAGLGGEQNSPTVVVGGDTRASTRELCEWLAAGLAAGGATCRFAGVLPTPAVSHLVSALGADCGVAVSASHNPFSDNGIKLIDLNGGKWPVSAERDLERRLLAGGHLKPAGPIATPDLEEDGSLLQSYRASLVAQLEPGRPLAGLRVALDTANGAASALAEPLFSSLGADVVAIHDRPDGRNINLACGSTHPQDLAKVTVRQKCDAGFAFDGDADRVVLVDELGTVHDGDALLYLWAADLFTQGELEPPTIVATSMSNLGLERALTKAGIGLVRCAVGDRAVAETMRDNSILLGGEQSGHVIRLDLAPTGDGLQSALHLAALLRRRGRPLSELLAGFERYPQTLVNVTVRAKPSFESIPAVNEAAETVRRRLGDSGRLLLRYSGTEPLARVMIEAESRELVETLAADLVDVIQEELGSE